MALFQKTKGGGRGGLQEPSGLQRYSKRPRGGAWGEGPLVPRIEGLTRPGARLIFAQGARRPEELGAYRNLMIWGPGGLKSWGPTGT